MTIGNQKGFIPLSPVIIIGLVALAGGTVAASQNAIPGDALYGLKNTTEKVRTVLSFTHSEKAKTHLSITLEKLEDIQKLQAQGGSGKQISEAAKSLKDNQDAAIQEFNQSGDTGQDAIDLTKRLQTNSEQQQNVLSDVLNKVPEAAKESIQHAAESSAKGLQKAQEVNGR